MKLKILATGIMLMMACSTLLATASLNNNIGKTATIEIKDIRVAIYTDEKEDKDFYGPYGRTRYFVWALNYSWQVGNTIYCFNSTLLPTKDLIKGDLTKDNYDVLLYPPDTYNEYLFSRGFKILPKNYIIKKQIKSFIEEGGGYYGSCGGALMTGDMLNKPKTFMERVTKNSMLGISCLGLYFEAAVPLLCQFIGISSKSIGSASLHLMYSGFNQTDYDINYHTGVCLDVPIMKDNPIFDDFLEETRRVRWVGAPNYVIPKNPDRPIYILANFPAEEMSDNKSTQNHYWTYTGGVKGLLKAVLKATSGQGKVHYWDNLGLIMSIYSLAGDWKMEEELFKTNFSNKPFWTAEIYPNENESRIIRCAGHPEDNVWWGGYIEEAKDTDNNNLFEGLYRWKDIIPKNQTVEDEFSYNYWTLRRCIAWAAKIPDNDLPSVYGPSEVSDIYPYEQSSNFKIIGNAKEELEGFISLDLYYRYSDDNISWCDWMLYETDINISNGWSWEFNASKANGTGYYQFYSIRKVQYDDHMEIETAPPGPDAIARVV